MGEPLGGPQTETVPRIDYDFPEKFVDELSRHEVFNKHLYRPNTYLHKWWARRCGSTFRAILKQLVPDSERQDYYAPGGLEGKIVLDPMMGGGTTLHEAIRLGANVIGADIDPIPVIQARASLTRASLESMRAAFDQFFEDLRASIGHYFRTECPSCQNDALNQSTLFDDSHKRSAGRLYPHGNVDIQYTLYGRRKACACRHVVQIDQYDLRLEPAKKTSICPSSWEIYSAPGEQRAEVGIPTLITKSEKKCPLCGQEYTELLDLPFYARYVPVAIAAQCADHGFFLRSPGDSDRARIVEADTQRRELDFGPTEDFAIAEGPKSSDLLKQNIRSYLDLFSSRQLLYLHHSIDRLRNYEETARLNLGMLVSTSLEFNSMLCGYKGWYKRRPGAIRHVFALHAYSPQYTALENNPINPNKTSGTLRLLFRDRIERGRKWATLPVERKINEDSKTTLIKMWGEEDAGVECFHQADLTHGQRNFWLVHGDSQDLPIDDDSVDLIVTDPPYYDNVQYSNLAAFFRVWLARLLPDETDWMYDETRSAVALKATDDDSGFLKSLAGIFAECGRVLKPSSGRMVFTFHHWDPNAWAELTIALKSAGFKMVNAYVVHSEHPLSVHVRNLNSITHDCILVFTLGGSSQSEHWDAHNTIDTKDSASFCRQCSAMLGWLLTTDFSPEDVRSLWNSSFTRSPNGR